MSYINIFGYVFEAAKNAISIENNDGIKRNIRFFGDMSLECFYMPKILHYRIIKTMFLSSIS